MRVLSEQEHWSGYLVACSEVEAIGVGYDSRPADIALNLVLTPVRHLTLLRSRREPMPTEIVKLGFLVNLETRQRHGCLPERHYVGCAEPAGVGTAFAPLAAIGSNH